MRKTTDTLAADTSRNAADNVPRNVPRNVPGNAARTALTLAALLCVLIGLGVATAQASQAAPATSKHEKASTKGQQTKPGKSGKGSVRPAVTSTLIDLDGATVPVGESVTLRGNLSDKGSRAVTLETRSGDVWVSLGQTSTDKAGRFSMPLPTHWYGTHTMRLVAPAASVAGQDRPGLYSPESRVTIAPDFTPAASTAFDLAGAARWNPCQTITWSYSTTAAPADGAAHEAVRAAFGEVARATGITFAEIATTTRRALIEDVEGTDAAPADLIIGWGTSTEIAEALGENYPGANPQRDAPDAIRAAFTSDSDHTRFVAGGALLNVDRHATRTPEAERALVMHQIGRILGLAPIRDAASVMNADGPLAAILSTGDLNGFRALGLDAGCR